MSAHRTNIYAHTAFIVIAGLLSLQGCSKPAAASPTAAEAAIGAEHIAHLGTNTQSGTGSCAYQTRTGCTHRQASQS